MQFSTGDGSGRPYPPGLDIWTVWEIRESYYWAEILEAYYDERGMWPSETVAVALPARDRA